MELTKNITELLVAVIGGAVTIGVAMLGARRYREEQRAKELAHHELELQCRALDFPSFLVEWDQVHHHVEELMETTNVDRFLILRCWNGSLRPKWTSAVYQIRQGSQQPVSYVHFELDEDYIQRIIHIVNEGALYFSIDTIGEETAIRRVYEAEGVTASLWFHLATLELTPTSKGYTYCSFATHEEEGLSQAEITKCRIVADRIRGVAGTFDHAPVQ